MMTIYAFTRGRWHNLMLVIFGYAALSMGCLGAQQPPKRAVVKKTAAVQPAADGSGERKFMENCSRCHSAPEQLSPRITGTIVLHMRVRASLSAEDARDILRYLSP